jgi:hypothetical protein
MSDDKPTEMDAARVAVCNCINGLVVGGVAQHGHVPGCPAGPACPCDRPECAARREREAMTDTKAGTTVSTQLIPAERRAAMRRDLNWSGSTQLDVLDALDAAYRERDALAARLVDFHGNGILADREKDDANDRAEKAEVEAAKYKEALQSVRSGIAVDVPGGRFTVSAGAVLTCINAALAPSPQSPSGPGSADGGDDV